MTELVSDLRIEGELERLRAVFDEVEPRVVAFVDEPERWSRVAAAVAGAPSGPLAGLPLAVKDVFRVDGLPTHGGSRVPPEALAGPESAVVSRLREAGAIVIGKAATTEFAYFAPGPTHNPHDLDHTPGGSSSGSAAAVATGQCVVALGTQTIGSVGRPASFCGVVGYKPSYERISREGLIALAPSFDHVGIFAPTVEWVERVAAVVARDWRAVPSVGALPVLGVPTGPYLESCDPEGREHFEAIGVALLAAGYAVREVEVMPDFEEIVARHRRVVAAEAARAHQPWFDRYREVYQPATVELVERGRGISDDRLQADLALCGELRGVLEAARRGAEVDLWICPPAKGPAPAGLASTGDPVMNLPWSQAGLPAVVVPAGFVGHLPMGLQLVGGWWEDELLLARAAAIAEIVAMGESHGETGER